MGFPVLSFSRGFPTKEAARLYLNLGFGCGAGADPPGELVLLCGVGGVFSLLSRDVCELAVAELKPLDCESDESDDADRSMCVELSCRDSTASRCDALTWF